MALTVSSPMSAAALLFPPIARSNFRCKNRAMLFVANGGLVGRWGCGVGKIAAAL